MEKSKDTLQSLQKLLETDTPNKKRDSFKYYSKIRVIPVRGDIIVLRSVSNYEYILITEINIDGKEDTWYRGYKLNVIHFTGIPRARSDLILNDPPVRKKFYPKKRLDVSIDIIDLVSYQVSVKEDKSMLTKLEAGYITPPPKELWPEENKGIRCGTCIYFKSRECALVKGEIHSQGCCNLWSYREKSDIGFISGEEINEILKNNHEW